MVLGAIGFASPRRILTLVGVIATPSGLYAIVCIRLSLGLVFLVAAAESRAPLYLQIMGGLALISGTLTLFLGVERVGRILDWWRARSDLVTRLRCVLVVLFGASLVWAVLPEAA